MLFMLTLQGKIFFFFQLVLFNDAVQMPRTVTQSSKWKMND